MGSPSCRYQSGTHFTPYRALTPAKNVLDLRRVRAEDDEMLVSRVLGTGSLIQGPSGRTVSHIHSVVAS